MKESYETVKRVLVKRAKNDPSGLKKAAQNKELASYLSTELNRLGVPTTEITAALGDREFIKSCNATANSSKSSSAASSAAGDDDDESVWRYSTPSSPPAPARAPNAAALDTTRIRGRQAPQAKPENGSDPKAGFGLDDLEAFLEERVLEPGFQYFHGNAWGAQLQQRIRETGWDMANQERIKEQLRFPRLFLISGSFFSILFALGSLNNGRIITGLLQGLVAYDMFRVGLNCYFKQYMLLCTRRMEVPTILSSISSVVSNVITGKRESANSKYFTAIQSDILLSDTYAAKWKKIFNDYMKSQKSD